MNKKQNITKVAVILGVRPNIIKLGPLIKKIDKDPELELILINTGQHYDDNMSTVFFETLGLPKPEWNLGVGSGSLTYQLSESMKGIERVFKITSPDHVIVIGDANPTLAGTIVAKNMDIPVMHLEAGVRSRDMDMPEERNRVMIDSIADYLIAPTVAAYQNLIGSNKEVKSWGDITVEAIDENLPEAIKLDCEYDDFILSTIHRAENTNDVDKLKAIMEALNECGHKVVMPIHPRTRKILDDNSLAYENIIYTDPLNYLEFLNLLFNCKLVVTDSGGLQKEAAILGKRYIVTRDTTEWKEGIKRGLGKYYPSGFDKHYILQDISYLLSQNDNHIESIYESKVSDTVIKSLKNLAS